MIVFISLSVDVRVDAVPLVDSRQNTHCDYFVTQSAQVFVALVQSSLFFGSSAQSSAVAAFSVDRSFPSHHDVVILIV